MRYLCYPYLWDWSFSAVRICWQNLKVGPRTGFSHLWDHNSNTITGWRLGSWSMIFEPHSIHIFKEHLSLPDSSCFDYQRLSAWRNSGPVGGCLHKREIKGAQGLGDKRPIGEVSCNRSPLAWVYLKQNQVNECLLFIEMLNEGLPLLPKMAGNLRDDPKPWMKHLNV